MSSAPFLPTIWPILLSAFPAGFPKTPREILGIVRSPRRHGVIKWSGAEYQLQLRATTKSGKSSVCNVEPIVRRHLAFSMEEWLTGRLEELGCDGAVFAPYLLAVLADADHSRYGVLCMCCSKSAPRRGTHSAHADGL